MVGLRELDERVIALEKKILNPCATCGLKEFAEKLEIWKRDDFANFINASQQSEADLLFKIDTNQDKEKVITNGIHATSNADLRLIVDLQKDLVDMKRTINELIDCYANIKGKPTN